MTQYKIYRVDVSECVVEASSPEEAKEIANASPSIWDYVPGELIVEGEE